MSILFQDIKERKVYWFLFPIVAFTAAYLYYSNTFFELFWRTSLINLGIIFSIILVLQTYSKFKLQTDLQHVFGLGDVLFFLAVSIAFPIATFIIFFVFSLLFSLLLHILLKNKTQETSVPLAGYMSLFFMTVYLLNWTGFLSNIYSI